MIMDSMKHLQLSLILLGISLWIAGHLFAETPDAAESPQFVFGVVADVQYCDCDPHGTRYYRHSIEKLTEAVQVFNANDLAFVIQLGDLIDRQFESFGEILPIYRQIEAPAYHILGNHDFLVAPADKPRILPTLDLEQRYYAFTVQGWRFLVLDGTDLSTYATPNDSAKYHEAEALLAQGQAAGVPQAQTWNGGLSQEQMAWVHAQLELAVHQDEQVVLFCHFPAFPRDKHALWNDTELIALLEAYPNVVAYMNGHNHAGNYGYKHGIHYVNLRGMVETADYTAYALVAVYPDHLQILGKGREPDRRLPARALRQ
ncbi:hypothetical protein GF339_19415 [candidate division KSB3 bacterium]|uniref:Calcineurin-like phosphoesterase domain-containing protein n=1 Tax=candidate division KSB3 bacterium TaxID=2044937 RepID=A0A9D5JYT5_9BACT|nr:hypothetical protein [candidate division KSB3 bacterium]MBD3326762.1 hypothetical protein [candidate division KSB3 bacterium]